MMNEDIITGLRNAVNSGESLEQAMQIMINSGYDSREVYEASKFVGKGVISTLQSRPDEQLTMPGRPAKVLNKENFLKSTAQSQQDTRYSQISENRNHSRFPTSLQQNFGVSNSVGDRQLQQQNQTLSQHPNNLISNIPKIQQSANQVLEEDHKLKKSYIKEIILLIILLILIGFLISTIIFKDAILGWFS